MRSARLPPLACALALALAGLAGCAQKPPASDPEALAEYQQTNDPYEPTNRFFYRVNDALQTYTLEPASRAYVFLVPRPVRGGIHNVLANLSSPVLLADDVSQGKPRRAGDTFMRFMINSSVGVLGVFDVARGWGYPAHDSNFGITLALWGVPEGLFLYLPFLGPSSPRGLAGFAADQAMDPFNYVPHGYGLRTLNWARFGLGTLDTYSRYAPDLQRVKASALDPYATFRSLYRQTTQSQINQVRDENRATTPDWYAR